MLTYEEEAILKGFSHVIAKVKPEAIQKNKT